MPDPFKVVRPFLKRPMRAVGSFSRLLLLEQSMFSKHKMGNYKLPRTGSSIVWFGAQPELLTSNHQKKIHNPDDPMDGLFAKIDRLFEPSSSESIKLIMNKRIRKGERSLLLKSMNLILTKFEALQSFPCEHLTASFNTIIQNNLVDDLIHCVHIEESIELLARVDICHEAIIKDPCVLEIWEYVAASQAKQGWYNIGLCHVLVENMSIAINLIGVLKLLKLERCRDPEKLNSLVGKLLSTGPESTGPEKLPLLIKYLADVIKYLADVDSPMLYSVEDFIKFKPSVFANMFQLMNISDGSKEVKEKIITSLKKRPTLTDRIMTLCEQLTMQNKVITASRFQRIVLTCEQELLKPALVVSSPVSAFRKRAHDQFTVCCPASSRFVHRSVIDTVSKDFTHKLFETTISFFSIPAVKKQDSTVNPISETVMPLLRV
jgi:hypothetical protein